MAKPQVPTYGLYGEAEQQRPAFWIHAESIASRSQLYNWEIRQHRHDSFFQLLHIRSGTGDAMLGTDTARLDPATLVVVPQGITHGFRFSRDIDGQVITIVTARLALRSPDPRLRAFIEAPRVLSIAADHSDGAFIATTLDRIGAELALGFGARSALIEAYLETVLTLAAPLAAPGDDATPTTSRDRARMARLNELIGTHFRAHHPIDFYAGELGVSTTHLNRIARAQTGRSISELLTDRIMSQARRDLVFTAMSAQEIAWDLGFSDPAYFTRFFSRQAGISPRRYREHERQALRLD